MTYSEARADISIINRQIRTTKITTLRNIAGFTSKDRQLNKDIQENSQVENMVRSTRQRRRALDSHLRKMVENRLAEIARNGRLRGTWQIVDDRRSSKRCSESWQFFALNQISNNNLQAMCDGSKGNVRGQVTYLDWHKIILYFLH